LEVPVARNEPFVKEFLSGTVIGHESETQNANRTPTAEWA
jgi:hypothetical protein